MKYNITLKINDQDYSEYLQEGLQIQETADETLDACSFVLDFMSKEDAFKPYTDINITITDDTTTKQYDMIVESDTVNTFYIGKNKKFTHNIIGVERTKLLEIPLPNIAITPKLGFSGGGSSSDKENGAWTISQNTSDKYIVKLINDEGTVAGEEFTTTEPTYESIYDVNMVVGGVHFVSMTTKFVTDKIERILPSYNGKYYVSGAISLDFTPLEYKTYWKRKKADSYREVDTFKNYPEYTIVTPSGSKIKATKTNVYSVSTPANPTDIPTETEISKTPWSEYTFYEEGTYTITVRPESTFGFIKCIFMMPEGNLATGVENPYTKRMTFNDSATCTVEVSKAAIEIGDKDKTLYSAIEKVLSSVKPNIATSAATTNGVDISATFGSTLPRFKLESTIADKLKNQQSPSFTFTNKTLLEALKSIGSVFNGIPRLIGDTVHYDIVDTGKDNANFNDSSEIETYGINSTNYGTGLTTNITNMVPALVQKTWPSDGSSTSFEAGTFAPARTIRGNYSISKSNLAIDLGELYIYKIDRIEMCNYSSTSPDEVLDITEFCIDKTVYDALPNTIAGKGIYIYYERNTPYIQGIGQVVDKGSLGGLISDTEYTINNILVKLDKYRNGAMNSPQNFRYKVTGTFYVNSTINTEKENSSGLDHGVHFPVLYNQEENNVDSDKFLKNSQRIISRLANPEINKNVAIESLSELPSLGELKNALGSKYLATIINTEYKNHNVVCSLQYSKNFNKISNYVGIDKEWKENTIETKDIVDRCITMNNYCYVDSRQYQTSDNGNSANYLDDVVKSFKYLCTGERNVLAPDGFLIFPIKRNSDSSYSRLLYRNNEGTEVYCKPAIIPATIVHGWNSVSMIGSAYDNYSLSTKAATKTGIGSDNLYDLRDVRYVDNYGECDCLFMNGINIYYYLETYKNMSSYFTFPEIPVDLTAGVMAKTKGKFMNSILVDVRKDNREKLSFNYQLSAVSKIDYVHVHSGLLKYLYKPNLLSSSTLLGEISIVGIESEYEPMCENVLSYGLAIRDNKVATATITSSNNTVILKQSDKLNPTKNYKWYAVVWNNTGDILLGIDRNLTEYNKYDILDGKDSIYFNFVDHRQETQ